MVVHLGLYVLALHVKEIVGAQVSPGFSFSLALVHTWRPIFAVSILSLDLFASADFPIFMLIQNFIIRI